MAERTSCYHNLFLKSPWTKNGLRFVFLSGESGSGGVSLSKKDVNELKGALEKQNLQIFSGKTNARLKRYEDHVKDLPDEFKKAMHDNIVGYFLTSVSRYDKDKERGLTGGEFQQYKSDMLAKVDEIMQRYAPSREAAEGKKHQEEGARGAAEAAREIVDIKIEKADFDPTNLISKEGDIARLQEEVIKMHKQSQIMRSEGQKLMQQSAEFKKAFKKFKEGKKEASVFWRGIKGTFVDDEETIKMQRHLDAVRNAFVEKTFLLEGKKREISDHGKKLDQAGDDYKQKVLSERDQRLQELDSKKDQADEKQKQDEEKYMALGAKKRENWKDTAKPSCKAANKDKSRPSKDSGPARKSKKDNNN